MDVQISPEQLVALSGAQTQSDAQRRMLLRVAQETTERLNKARAELQEAVDKIQYILALCDAAPD